MNMMVSHMQPACGPLVPPLMLQPLRHSLINTDQADVQGTLRLDILPQGSEQIYAQHNGFTVGMGEHSK